MAIKTAEEYKEGLKDKREIYFQGKKIKAADMFSDPVLNAGIELCAMDYRVAQLPQYYDLFNEIDEDGTPYSFTFKSPTTSADLLRRAELIKTLSRICLGLPGGAKFAGVDSLHALTSVSHKIDAEIGTNYSERVELFRKSLKANDSALVMCMTDVKGDRSLRPHQQSDPDAYLHIVEERSDGIVVTGAKANITYAPFTDEIVVLPCRNMTAKDKDYAVAFSIPPATKGIKLILAKQDPGYISPVEHPINAARYAGDAIVVFDNVFIPMERVFLKGEYQYAIEYTNMFTNYHRLSGDSYKIADLEIILGCAALMADYMGLSKSAHIREKLAWLVYYAETAQALGKCAGQNPVQDKYSGMVYPDPMYSNCTKFFFADNYHAALKILQDIGGGVVSTLPSGKDTYNPEIKAILEKYLAGRSGVPGLARIKAMYLARDLAEGIRLNGTIHAEGSLFAQKLRFYGLGNWERYKSAAKRAGRITEDGPLHEDFANLPEFPVWEEYYSKL